MFAATLNFRCIPISHRSNILTSCTGCLPNPNLGPCCCSNIAIRAVRAWPRPPQYALVTVQTHRAVSNAIAQKLGIRHETPQALLVKDGRVVWSASHFGVTAAAVEDALRNQP